VKRYLLAVSLAVSASLFGSLKKPSGQILDRQGLRNIHTYCVDVQGLTRNDADAVQGFLKEQNSSLWSQFPWTKMDDCSESDAVMTFRFSERKEPDQASQGGSPYAVDGAGAVATGGAGIVYQTWFQVTALVTLRSSQTLVTRWRERAPRNAASGRWRTHSRTLVKDVKSVQP
jgi:hypothetical protein